MEFFLLNYPLNSSLSSDAKHLLMDKLTVCAVNISIQTDAELTTVYIFLVQTSQFRTNINLNSDI